MAEAAIYVGLLVGIVWGMLILPLAFLTWIDRRDK